MAKSRLELLEAQLKENQRKRELIHAYVGKLNALEALLIPIALGNVEESELQVPLERARIELELARKALEDE